MPNTVHVTFNNLPVFGAVVTVTMPGLGFGIGGFNGISSTDDSGNATFPNGPDFFGGSSADVGVTWTDAQGNQYAGLGEWGLGTLGGWSPNPLDVALVLSVAVTKQAQNQQSTETSTSKNPFNLSTYEVYIIVAIVILIVGIVGYVVVTGAPIRKSIAGAASK